MARVLTKLRIDEVSACDVGAGEGTKIVLMKRAYDQPVRPGRSLFLDCLDEVLKAEAADDGDDDAGSLTSHPAVQMARLLVASGKFGDHRQALDYLLNKPGGQALLARMHKAAEPAKETTMPTTETLESILKDLGPISFCKAIVDRGRAPCTEAELVALLSKRVAEQYNMPGDRAFAKLHAAEILVRQACAIAKAAEFSVFDVKPVVVGGADAQDVNNATAAVAARREIERIGREKFPFLSADQQFARVFDDSKYAALARQVHQRPSPTTIYEMPGSDAPGRGAYTKADPAPSADSAYATLLAKARDYQTAHPELSEAQCFAQVYTDRGNIELAKRERMESVPR